MGRRPPPRRAPELPSTQCRTNRLEVGRAERALKLADAPATLGSGPARRQQQRGQQRQERRARPAAAARPVHSSSRGSGGGGSQAAPRRASTGSARGPSHLVPVAHPAGCQGRLRVLCPSNLLLRFRPAAQDPVSAVPPSPSGCSLAAAGQSVQSRVVGRTRGRVSPARTLKTARPTPGAPSQGSLRGPAAAAPPLCALALLRSASLNLSLSATLQPSAWAPTNGGEADPGRRPSALCCRLSTPAPSGRPESCCSRASSKPTPLPRHLKPAARIEQRGRGWGGGPRGHLTERKPRLREVYLARKPVAE